MAYHRPGFRTRLVAWILEVIPKVGPFKSWRFALRPRKWKTFHGQLQRDGGQLPRTAGKGGRGQPGLAEREFRSGTPTVAGNTRAPILPTTIIGKLTEHKFVECRPIFAAICWTITNRKPPSHRRRRRRPPNGQIAGGAEAARRVSTGTAADAASGSVTSEGREGLAFPLRHRVSGDTLRNALRHGD